MICSVHGLQAMNLHSQIARQSKQRFFVVCQSARSRLTARNVNRYAKLLRQLSQLLLILLVLCNGVVTPELEVFNLFKELWAEV